MGKTDISTDVKKKLPTVFSMLIEQKTFWVLFGFGFCVFALYGKIAGEPERKNGYLFFVGPFFLSLMAFVLRGLYPWNPFKTVGARMFGSGGSETDPDADRLVQLLGSDAARKYLLQVTLKLCVILFLTMLALASLQREPFLWTLGPICFDCPASFLLGVFGCYIGTTIVQHPLLACWAVKTWSTTNDE